MSGVSSVMVVFCIPQTGKAINKVIVTLTTQVLRGGEGWAQDTNIDSLVRSQSKKVMWVE